MRSGLAAILHKIPYNSANYGAMAKAIFDGDYACDSMDEESTTLIVKSVLARYKEGQLYEVVERLTNEGIVNIYGEEDVFNEPRKITMDDLTPEVTASGVAFNPFAMSDDRGAIQSILATEELVPKKVDALLANGFGLAHGNYEETRRFVQMIVLANLGNDVGVTDQLMSSGFSRARTALGRAYIEAYEAAVIAGGDITVYETVLEAGMNRYVLGPLPKVVTPEEDMNYGK